MSASFENDIDLIVDKHFPLMQVAKAPIDRKHLACLSFSGVYFLCARGGPYYIGCSSSIGTRIISHLDTGRVKDNILVIRTNTWIPAYYLETLFLEKFQPAMNKRKKEYGRSWVSKTWARELNKVFRKLAKAIPNEDSEDDELLGET